MYLHFEAALIFEDIFIWGGFFWVIFIQGAITIFGTVFTQEVLIIYGQGDKNLEGGGAHWALDPREVILKSQIWKI